MSLHTPQAANAPEVPDSHPAFKNVRGYNSQPGQDYEWMKPFSGSHFTVMVTGIIAAGVFIVAARRIKGVSNQRRARAMSGWILAVLMGLWQAHILRPKQIHLTEALPLHLSDWLRPITAYALITDSEWARGISWYWGLLLNPQALVTPFLPYVHSPKWLQFGAYWFFHWVALIVPLVMHFSWGWRPSVKHLRQTTGFTLVWLAVARTSNRLLGSNYGFIERKNPTPSFIEVAEKLGFKGNHLPFLCVVVLAAWYFLLTLPFQEKK